MTDLRDILDLAAGDVPPAVPSRRSNVVAEP
jgi:hypothetical protein